MARQHYRRVRLWYVAAAVAVVGAMVATGGLVESPSVVERITVENPTRYDITIDVTDGARDGWMGIGTARRQATSTFEQVIDQGGVWVFRFSAQGHDGGGLRLTRQDLARGRWRMGIPERAGEQLEAKGAPLPP